MSDSKRIVERLAENFGMDHVTSVEALPAGRFNIGIAPLPVAHPTNLEELSEILQMASLMASGYEINGGSAYTGAILTVADQLGLTLPDLLARPR